MRRILRVIKWLGVGVSTLLFVATLILWGRGVGHEESWELEQFEPEPGWTTGRLVGMGTRRWCNARATHGRLWLGWGTRSPVDEFKSETRHERRSVSADKAKEWFESTCRTRDDSDPDGSFDRVWNGAGVGFCHGRSSIDPQTGRPTLEGFLLVLPFWLLALLFGSWPAGLIALRVLRRRRLAPHCCPKCGYDLRATPDASGPILPRCPECGRETAEEQKIA